MMARKPVSRSSEVAPPNGSRRRFGPFQRLQPEAGDGAERGHRCDHPDQVPCRDDVDQQPADQRADHEGRRAPQPHRPVVEPEARHAAQRIGVRQRQHRRPQRAGGGIGQQHHQRQVLGADHGKAERGRKGGHGQRPAQRIAPVGRARDERQHREPGQRGHRGNDADPRRIDADRLQPDREKRQVGTHRSERRAIEQRQPASESLRRNLRCDGDL